MRAAHRGIGVRFLTGNAQSDPETTRRPRRNDFDAGSKAFLEVLLIANELHFLHAGRIRLGRGDDACTGGSVPKIPPHRALWFQWRLRKEIKSLMRDTWRAVLENASNSPRMPADSLRRRALKSRIDRACAEPGPLAGSGSSVERVCRKAWVLEENFALGSSDI